MLVFALQNVVELLHYRFPLIGLVGALLPHLLSNLKVPLQFLIFLLKRLVLELELLLLLLRLVAVLVGRLLLPLKLLLRRQLSESLAVAAEVVVGERGDVICFKFQRAGFGNEGVFIGGGIGFVGGKLLLASAGAVVLAAVLFGLSLSRRGV